MRRSDTRAVVVRAVVLLALALTVCAGAASAYTAKPTPLLTYVATPRSETARPLLCLARPDGKRRVELTRAPRPRAVLGRASWNPRGSQFAFVEGRIRPSGAALAVADVRGRTVRTLLPSFDYPPLDPVWSPDGRWIATTGGGRGGSLLVVPARGGRARELARSLTLSAGFRSPAWTHDSRRLAFAYDARGVPTGVERPSGIYTVGADGRNLRLVVADADMPAYSRDGSKLAYVRAGDVYVAAADGSQPRRLTDTAAAEDRPAWSPDGRLLAFSRTEGSRSVIVVARSDGSSERTVVSRSRFDATLPSWRPAAPFALAGRRACP